MGTLRLPWLTGALIVFVDVQPAATYVPARITTSCIEPIRAPAPGTASHLDAVLAGAQLSLLEYPSSVRPSALHLDELEDAFCAWAHDPAKPDVVDLGLHGDLSMVELSRRLEGSRATLGAAVCAQFGLPPGVTIATAVAALLHATVDPDGPRCRSFRAASYYLRGLARLDADFWPTTSYLDTTADDERSRRDVR